MRGSRSTERRSIPTRPARCACPTARSKAIAPAARRSLPATTFAGLFERATGADPFKLPDTWIAARGKLDPAQPFNFVTTNDIVGGNSGSPVINKAGEIVGVLFDHNREALGGAFGYDPAVNRAISVNVGAIREALSQVYGADRLLDELNR